MNREETLELWNRCLAAKEAAISKGDDARSAQRAAGEIWNAWSQNVPPILHSNDVTHTDDHDLIEVTDIKDNGGTASGNEEQGAELSVESDVVFDKFTFDADADFAGFVFPGKTSFCYVAFNGHAKFDSAQFAGQLLFKGASFGRSTSFADARFHEKADFNSVNFAFQTSFKKTAFKKDAIFTNTIFAAKVTFRGAKFFGSTKFYKSRFKEDATFSYVQFIGQLGVVRVTFEAQAFFDVCIFIGEAKFSRAEFTTAALFRGARFKNISIFDGSNFHDAAVFTHARFKDNVSFNEVRCLPIPSKTGQIIASEYGPIWSSIQFSLKNAFLITGIQSASTADRSTACLFGATRSLNMVEYTPSLSPLVVVISGLQSVLSAVLIFLSLLGVRNHFRIK